MDFLGRQSNGVSNGLSGELKLRIFKKVVEEDDEFAHHRSERDFLGLTGGEEPLIKRLEDRVEARGDEDGHAW